jgi:hypothetical protein
VNYPEFDFIYEKSRKKENEPIPLYQEVYVPSPIPVYKKEEENKKEIIIQLFL